MQDQALGMKKPIGKLLEEDARVRREQAECQQEYDTLSEKTEKISREIWNILDAKKDRTNHKRRNDTFLQRLGEQEECIEYDRFAFVAKVDKVKAK